MKTVILSIRGRVQGVSFRINTQKQGIQLGLTGYVKNLSDGSVEAYATGNEKAIEEFIDWCHKGPKFAKVTQLTIQELDAVASYNSFEIL